jgi:8-oxo-dGTP pyrophosphatase MutT (NUDIX family)
MSFLSIVKMNEESQKVHKGAGVLSFCPKTCRFHLQKRAKGIKDPLTYDYFGGGVDPGENPLEAAVREYQEEGGVTIDEDDLQHLGVYGKAPEQGLGGYHVFIHITPEEFEGTPRPGEVESCDWLSLTDLMNKKVHDRVTAVLKDPNVIDFIKDILEG